MQLAFILNSTIFCCLQGALALFVFCYLILMSIGAGLAIPGGLFMPAILVSVE